jgi:hypothetical protein
MTKQRMKPNLGWTMLSRRRGCGRVTLAERRGVALALRGIVDVWREKSLPDPA